MSETVPEVAGSPKDIADSHKAWFTHAMMPALIIVVTAFLMAAIGTGTVFFTTVLDESSIPQSDNYSFISQADQEHADSIHEEGSFIILQNVGFSIIPTRQGDEIESAQILFDFDFTCQGVGGDYVIYRFEGDGLKVQKTSDATGIPESTSFSNELTFTPSDPVKGKLIISITPENEALKRWHQYHDPSDAVEFRNDSLSTINQSLLIVTCYKDDEVVKELSYYLLANGSSWIETNSDPTLLYSKNSLVVGLVEAGNKNGLENMVPAYATNGNLGYVYADMLQHPNKNNEMSLERQPDENFNTDETSTQAFKEAIEEYFGIDSLSFEDAGKCAELFNTSEDNETVRQYLIEVLADPLAVAHRSGQIPEDKIDRVDTLEAYNDLYPIESEDITITESTLESILKIVESKTTILIPVYDTDGKTVIGEYEVIEK